MQLPPQQVERFYRIWFPLLHYVNKQVHLTTTFPDAPRPGAISQADAMLIRNALWANDGVRESFIATNPAGLPPADLALVASWQYRVAEDFFIVRHLKSTPSFSLKGQRQRHMPMVCWDLSAQLKILLVRLLAAPPLRTMGAFSVN